MTHGSASLMIGLESKPFNRESPTTANKCGTRPIAGLRDWRRFVGTVKESLLSFEGALALAPELPEV